MVHHETRDKILEISRPQSIVVTGSLWNLPEPKDLIWECKEMFKVIQSNENTLSSKWAGYFYTIKD